MREGTETGSLPIGPRILMFGKSAASGRFLAHFATRILLTIVRATFPVGELHRLLVLKAATQKFAVVMGNGA
jgi:uncharacterized protein (DUF3820 family)